MPLTTSNILTSIAPNAPLDLLVSSTASSHCLSSTYTTSIQAVTASGIKTTMASFISRSASMYIRNQLANASQISPSELNLAYALFEFASPLIVVNNSKNRLVIQKSINSRLQAVITETMAIGASILAGEHIFGIPLQFWFPTPKLQRLDFRADFNGSVYGLEAKGRIDPNIVSAQISIEDKFQDTAVNTVYHHAIGSIYTPSVFINSIAKYRPVDITVIDPENGIPKLDELAELRSTLKHHSYIYKAQGYNDVFDEIHRITSDGNREDLLAFNRNGLKNLRPGRKWRTRFFIKDLEYVGTAWSDAPALFSSEKFSGESGGYMWGINRHIHEAILGGDIESLLTFTNKADEEDFWEGPYRYIITNDGTAIGWAPSLSLLLDMP